MRTAGSFTRRVASLAACTLSAALLGGCAFSPQLSQVAVEHNRMVAKSADELTLLNIVRASRRFPLHFTAVTEVNGNARIAIDADLGTALNPGPNPDSLSTGASFATSPSFTASVLATDKFQRGIQAPIPTELVAYYLDEGWRDELVMALMIERVEAYRNPEDTEPAFAIVNNPGRTGAFARLLCTHGLQSLPTTSSVPLARFDELIDAAKMAKPETSSADRRKEISSLLELLGKDGVRLNGDTLMIEGSTNAVRLTRRETSRCNGVAPDAELDQFTLRLRFRSTLGLVYFLGEYLRVSDDFGPDSVYQLPTCADPCDIDRSLSRPIIALRKGGGESLVETSFRGTRYYVTAEEERPDPIAGPAEARSLQVIAFVQQLINLQKSADALPRSLNITGIN